MPGLDIKISGCPNGCGQHHIAGIGFQGSLRKVGGRPAPQYFVMVGGGVDDGIDDLRPARRDVPARRAPKRSSGWCGSIATKARRSESPLAFFRRSKCRGSRRCSPISRSSTPETASETDFIDLAEDHAFKPEVMDGECSA